METFNETGLLVNFKNSNPLTLSKFFNDTEYYCYETELGTFLFPCSIQDCDIFELELTKVFNSLGIEYFTFEINEGY